MGEFRMPSLGADMDEGTLVEWLVAPGDAVHRGDIVAVVDTAKSAIEIEVFEDGVVRASCWCRAGTTVPVGDCDRAPRWWRAHAVPPTTAEDVGPSREPPVARRSEATSPRSRRRSSATWRTRRAST